MQIVNIVTAREQVMVLDSDARSVNHVEQESRYSGGLIHAVLPLESS
jgi:hypothetical protein